MQCSTSVPSPVLSIYSAAIPPPLLDRSSSTPSSSSSPVAPLSPIISATTSFVTYDRRSRPALAPTSISPSASVSVKNMANPSSSHDHRDRDRERERIVRERSHHHHRTISSTTLLLILSLVLAVLAVMLSLPSTRGTGSAASNAMDALRGTDSTSNGAGLWGSFFNPRRSEALISREHSVAKRESEVAQREADILAGALVTCSPYATVTEVIETMAPLPVQTIYKEVIHHNENAVAVPAPLPTQETNTSDLTRRIEELIQRETKVADREKDMSRREEILNRREHDAQRREAWIMEQLIVLGNDPQVIEEEYVIDQPMGKRKVKAFPPPEKPVTRSEKRSAPVPPSVPSSSATLSPASTRPAEYPMPVSFKASSEPPSVPTTVSEIIYENVPLVPEPEYDEEEETVTIRRMARNPPPRRRLW